MNYQNVDSIRKDTTPRTIYSPLTHTLTVDLLDDDNNQYQITVPSKDILTLPGWQSEIIKRKVIDALMHDRGIGIANANDIKALEKELEWKL